MNNRIKTDDFNYDLGFFIAFIGMQSVGIVVHNDATSI